MYQYVNGTCGSFVGRGGGLLGSFRGRETVS
jgi:hypothetical protein